MNIDKWNGNRFIPFDNEEKTALELMLNMNKQSNEIINELDNKVDQGGNFTGSWHGIERPEFSEPGIANVVIKNTDDIKKVSVSLLPKNDGEIDDTLRLQRTINQMNDGDSLLLPQNLVISDTINMGSKNIKIFGNGSHGINRDINYCHILFKGNGVLFYTGDNTSQVVFDGLILKGMGNNSQMAIQMFTHKSIITNCTISDFGVGIFFKHSQPLSWSGENNIKNNFIHYCDIAVKLEVDTSQGIVYDSYLEHNIIHSCRKWIVADKLHNWALANNHFYSSVSQQESRVDIASVEGLNINDNYIEMESEVRDLFKISIKSSLGGLSIYDNKIFYSNPNTMTHEASVFNINNKVIIKNVNISGNYYFSRAEQPNLYLLKLSNQDNAFYGALMNNEIPIRQLYKSVRETHAQEVRLIHQEYNTRFGQGIQINDYNPEERCLITSSKDYSSMTQKGGVGLHFVLDTGAIYYNNGNGYKKISEPKVFYPISPLNGWSDTGYMSRVTTVGDIVDVHFSLQNGTKDDGTLLFKLPSNRIPSKHMEVIVHGKNGNSIVLGEIFVNRINGEVTINNFANSGSNKVTGHFSYVLGD